MERITITFDNGWEFSIATPVAKLVLGTAAAALTIFAVVRWFNLRDRPSSGPPSSTVADVSRPALSRTRQILWILLFSIVALVGSLGRGNPAVLFGCLAVWLFVGIALDSWPIICTLLGAFCGFIFQPLSGSGTIESRIWTTVEVYLFWTTIGVIAGILIDGMKRRSPPGSAPKIS